MFYTQDRNKLRQFMCEVWRKYRKGEPMEPMEIMIGEVIAQHREYHKLFEDSKAAISHDYLPEMGETNPFLHISMHIAIKEQISSDRPSGIADIYRQLSKKGEGDHDVEHRMMEPLAEMIWQSQRQNGMPDEQSYMENLRRLARA